MHKKVEGVNWTVSEVVKFTTQDEFVTYFMKEPSLYSHMKPHRKEETLKLTYSVCVPNVVAPEPEPVVEVPEKKKRHARPAADSEGEE